jgi:hypothetical protein
MGSFSNNKQIGVFATIICCVLMLLQQSCKTNNSIVSCFGQRKYTKGYYSFLRSKPKEFIPRTQIAVVSKTSYRDKTGKPEDAPKKVNYIINYKSTFNSNNTKSNNSSCKIRNSEIPICHESKNIADPEINRNSSIRSDNSPENNNQQAKPYNTGKAVLGVILIILGIIGVLFSIFLLEFATSFGGSVGSNEIVPLILSIAILIIGIVTIAKA